MPIARAIALAAVLFAGARNLHAQVAEGRGAPIRLEARVDGFFARGTAVHAGVGVTTDLGAYVRLDAVLAGGAWRIDGTTTGSGRAEILGRFLLDPFRQSRWGFYGGGGLIARQDGSADTNGYLTLLIGAELPGDGLTLPAVEVGIGGGTRVGLVIRRGRPNRR